MGSKYTDSHYHKAAGFSSMTATDYSDATPDVAITYDALGRQHTVQSAVAQSQFAYEAATLALAQETITYTVPGLAPFTRQLDRRQDALGRATGYTLVDAGSAGGGTGSPALPGAALPFEQKVSYHYQPTSGRFAAVTSESAGAAGALGFLYGYQAQSSLVQSVQSFTGYDHATQAGTPLHQVTHGYEPHRDVLLTKTNTRSSDGATMSGIGYTVNTIGQRTSATRSGAATHLMGSE
jgi:hypothetical protein